MECFVISILIFVIFYVLTKGDNTDFKRNRTSKTNSTFDSTKVAQTVDLEINSNGNEIPLNQMKFQVVNENQYLQKIIDEEFKKNNYKASDTCPELDKRRLVVSLLYSVMNIYALFLIFFQRSFLWAVCIMLISLACFLAFYFKFNIKSIILKQIKNRPDEEFENVIAGVMAKCTSKIVDFKILLVIFVPIIIWLICFKEPRLYYENYEDGKSLRWYSIGFNNPEYIEVPSKVEGKTVIRVRGDIFTGVPNVKEIKFNEGLKELRGQSFIECDSLQKIILPSSLTYLGGECFTDCQSLKYINLGDTKIEEVKGETFKGCKSLIEIEIPNTANRIGGHAFESCYNLQKVTIPKSVKTIGSSAFRDCNSLKYIMIYKGTDVNERAFKNSPTNIVWID